MNQNKATDRETRASQSDVEPLQSSSTMATEGQCSGWQGLPAGPRDVLSTSAGSRDLATESHNTVSTSQGTIGDKTRTAVPANSNLLRQPLVSPVTNIMSVDSVVSPASLSAAISGCIYSDGMKSAYETGGVKERRGVSTISN